MTEDHTMNDAVSKDSFLDIMRSQRGEWEGLLGQVAREDMQEAGGTGSWSVRDVIVHVTAYERGLVEWLEAAARGEVKAFADLDHPDLDYRNALILAQSRGQSLADVQATAASTFSRLLELVEVLPEGELTASERTECYVRPRWGERRALWECIADDSYRHYGQHMPLIRRWLEGRARDS